MDGSVPLWEAMKGRHESVMKILIDNGADISLANAGHLACSAVEQNNMELLKEIIQCGMDVTQPKKNGATALHTAVVEGNTEMINFLVDQGADIDMQDVNGWTPRVLAEQSESEEIKNIFHDIKDSRKPGVIPISKNDNRSGRFQIDPSMLTIPQESMLLPPYDGRRRSSSSFDNSIFGMMSTANRGTYILEQIDDRVMLYPPTKLSTTL